MALLILMLSLADTDNRVAVCVLTLLEPLLPDLDIDKTEKLHSASVPTFSKKNYFHDHQANSQCIES